MTPATADRIRAAALAFADEIIAALTDEPAAALASRLLSVDEAAAALGVGRTALYGELEAGRLSSLKVGRRRLIATSAIADFIAARARR